MNSNSLLLYTVLTKLTKNPVLQGNNSLITKTENSVQKCYNQHSLMNQDESTSIGP